MAVIAIGTIIDAIAATLSTTAFSADLQINRTQSYNQLTEGMNTLPTLQVYPETWEVSSGSETDRISFVDAVTGIPGHRVTEITVFLDLYVRQRSQLNEDWGEAIDLAGALGDKLDEEGPCPHLGSEAIRSFHWVAQRVVFVYAQVEYIGFRFTLTIVVH
jgi:hypothetical protein